MAAASAAATGGPLPPAFGASPVRAAAVRPLSARTGSCGVGAPTTPTAFSPCFGGSSGGPSRPNTGIGVGRLPSASACSSRCPSPPPEQASYTGGNGGNGTAAASVAAESAAPTKETTTGSTHLRDYSAYMQRMHRGQGGAAGKEAARRASVQEGWFNALRQDMAEDLEAMVRQELELVRQDIADRLSLVRAEIIGVQRESTNTYQAVDDGKRVALEVRSAVGGALDEMTQTMNSFGDEIAKLQRESSSLKKRILQVFEPGRAEYRPLLAGLEASIQRAESIASKMRQTTSDHHLGRGGEGGRDGQTASSSTSGSPDEAQRQRHITEALQLITTSRSTLEGLREVLESKLFETRSEKDLLSAEKLAKAVQQHYAEAKMEAEKGKRDLSRMMESSHADLVHTIKNVGSPGTLLDVALKQIVRDVSKSVEGEALKDRQAVDESRSDLLRASLDCRADVKECTAAILEAVQSHTIDLDPVFKCVQSNRTVVDFTPVIKALTTIAADTADITAEALGPKFHSISTSFDEQLAAITRSVRECRSEAKDSAVAVMQLVEDKEPDWTPVLECIRASRTIVDHTPVLTAIAKSSMHTSNMIAEAAENQHGRTDIAPLMHSLRESRTDPTAIIKAVEVAAARLAQHISTQSDRILDAQLNSYHSPSRLRAGEGASPHSPLMRLPSASASPSNSVANANAGGNGSGAAAQFPRSSSPASPSQSQSPVGPTQSGQSGAQNSSLGTFLKEKDRGRTQESLATSSFNNRSMPPTLSNSNNAMSSSNGTWTNN